jgi:hypothetical protein
MFEQLNAEIKELEDYFLNPKNIQNLFQKAASQTGGVKRKL